MTKSFKLAEWTCLPNIFILAHWEVEKTKLINELNIFRPAAHCVTLVSSWVNILYEADMFIFSFKNHLNVEIYWVKMKLKCKIFWRKNILRIFIREQYSPLFWQVCSIWRGGVAVFRSEHQQVTKSHMASSINDVITFWPILDPPTPPCHHVIRRVDPLPPPMSCHHVKH